MKPAAQGQPRARDPLDSYARKRSFDATPEPRPGAAEGREGPLLFVVQQHAARRMHWDFRLEAGGVLLSWAVPNGPSLVTGDKRLAVRTEDHPFEYASFEGVIPKGQYGAGEVIVWDTGVYSPDEDGEYAFDDRRQAEQRVAEGLARGKLSIFLRGHKLKGSFALVRMKDGENWLLLKHGDRFSRTGAPVTDQRQSVLSGLTVEDLRRPGVSVPRIAAARLAPGGRLRPLPKRIAPMLATPVAEPFNRPGWRFEPKLDGYRALAIIENGEARLHSRRGGLDLNKPFPDIIAELSAQGVGTMILDGELLAFDREGRPSFHALQNAVPGPKPRGARAADADVGASACVLYCFDLLYFAGVDLQACTYSERRRYLEQCLLPSTHVQLVHVEDDGLALYSAAIEAGFEGVVAKRCDSKYEAGRRSRHWLKVKRVDTADFVVGGYTRGKGWRASQFGSLLLGVPVPGGKLKYTGRVGSGFNDALLADLKRRFEPIVTRRMPFLERPEESQGATWVEPTTVVEVRYAEVTPLGQLRAPVFVRVRDDKTPADTVPAQPADDGDAAHEAAFEVRAAASHVDRAGGRKNARQESKRRAGQRRDDSGVPDDIAAVLAQLRGEAVQMPLEVQGETIALTNLDKVLWPEAPELDQRAYTKRDFLGYLAQVSPYMLPHLADRPLTMIRMPDGIHGERFFQKHWEHKLPRFVERIEVYSESKNEQHEYLMCNNLATLLWLGQIGTLEFHVWHSRANPAPELTDASTDYASSLEALEASVLNYPDYVVFDLDPYIYSGKEKRGAEPELNEVAFERGKEVAFWLRDLMRAMALEPIVKTSGKTGLHVFLPIVRTIDFDAARAVCETIGRHLMQQHPDAITMEWSTKKRTGKIFFDHNMNARGKTLNVAYSPRGVAGTPVSMPLTWEELERAHPMDFRMDNVVERLRRNGDRWADALSAKQDLTLSLAAGTGTEAKGGKRRRASREQ